jgi:hypothetical protein
MSNNNKDDVAHAATCSGDIGCRKLSLFRIDVQGLDSEAVNGNC